MMRILEARFKNLNSLRGEWRIDFTNPAYAGNGIFCITGPTGAGKTSIMDAICLALYGRTPRLDRINKNENEIMARHTGECFAEVCFETKAGRFRCRWSQHRARRKPEGELQNPRHEISNDDTGQVLESKLREVAQAIENVTGMDFDRFTRSMLLAQGGFAAFLQAPPDERSPILEQITGTEIYSQISIKVHQRRGEERKRMENLQAAVGNIELLSTAEEDALNLAKDEKVSILSQIAAEVEMINKALSWLEVIDGLKNELEGIEEQWQEYQNRKIAFASDLLRLNRAYKALAVEGDYQLAVALRKQQKQDTILLEEAQKELPRREEELAKVRDRHDALVIQAEQAKLLQKDEAAKIKLVRELELKLDSQQKLIDKMTLALTANREQYKKCEQKVHVINQAMQKSTQAIRETTSYLEEHAGDAALIESFSAIKQTIMELQKKQTDELHSSKQLHEAAEAINLSQASCLELAAAYDDSSLSLKGIEQEYSQLNLQIQNLLKGQELNSWRQQMEDFKQRKNYLEQAHHSIAQINSARSALESLERQLQLFKEESLQVIAEIARLREKIELKQKDIGHLEKEVALLNRIHDLEEERKKLRDGETCPLCGATEHPFAQGNIPVLTDSEAALGKAREEKEKLNAKMLQRQVRITELDKDIEKNLQAIEDKGSLLKAEENYLHELRANLGLNTLDTELPAQIKEELSMVEQKIASCQSIISEAEQLERTETNIREALDQHRSAHNEANRAWQEAGFKQQLAEQQHKRLLEEKEARGREIGQLLDRMKVELEPYGFNAVSELELSRIIDSLEQRRMRWQETQTERINEQNKNNDLRVELSGHTASLTRLRDEIENQQQENEHLHKAYGDLRNERLHLYGNKNPDEEEIRCLAQVEQVEREVQEVYLKQQEAQQEVSDCQRQITRLEDSIHKRSEELTSQEDSLQSCLTRAGFSDEADYRCAVMKDEEREQLDIEAERLRREENELASRREDRQRRLRTEEAKSLSHEPYETLQKKLAVTAANQTELQEDIYTIKAKLNDNQERKALQQEKLGIIAAQKKECGRWDMLHDLIGSADGKRYRNFAQGLTFDILIAHANRQLQKMSDRYLLITDLAHPLEINVVDNYQGGEIRSAKNLSGGESFIVSLALALGLSGMVSRNMNIDTLFLDEGFGTLDQDALDSALETLAGIQQEGKMIGIISHVPGLQERISTRIEVIPKNGGYSVLAGPGCTSGASEEATLAH